MNKDSESKEKDRASEDKNEDACDGWDPDGDSPDQALTRTRYEQESDYKLNSFKFFTNKEFQESSTRGPKGRRIREVAEHIC